MCCVLGFSIVVLAVFKFVPNNGIAHQASMVVGFVRILLLHPEELQRHFEEEAPVSAKHPSKYARHLLEYSCFRALSVAAQVTDHLSDKEFRRLSFDMMLAWEAPGATNRPVVKVRLLNSVLCGSICLSCCLEMLKSMPKFMVGARDWLLGST